MQKVKLGGTADFSSLEFSQGFFDFLGNNLLNFNCAAHI